MFLTIFETEPGFEQAASALGRDGEQWMRFGDIIAVLGNEDAVRRTGETKGLQESARYTHASANELFVIGQKGRLFQKEHTDISVFIDRGRYLLVHIDDSERLNIIKSHVEPCYSVMPWRSGTTVFSERSSRIGRPGVPNWISELVASVDRTMCQPLIDHLVSFRTRHSLEPEFTQAANWTKQQLESHGLEVTLEPIDVNGSASMNVVGIKPGESPSGDIICVVAHLDSVNAIGGQSAIAPGADDNASGSAGAIAIAAALSSLRSSNELRVILFGGEEQGLFGSKQYVANLSPEERGRITAVLNMDMIGTKNTPVAQVLLEGATISQAMIDSLADSAAQFTSLHVQASLNPFASDHVPFLDAGIPAVLTIEGADSTNQSIHTAADTLDKIDYNYAVEILKMNVGFVANALGRMQVEGRCDGRGVVGPLSGRFRYTGSGMEDNNRNNFSLRGSLRDQDERRRRSFDETSAFDPEPVFVSDKVEFAASRATIEIVLHVDIDGTNPLDVVSGTVQKGMLLPGQNPEHFVGKVASRVHSDDGLTLTVRGFSLNWPDRGRFDSAVVIVRDQSPSTATISFSNASSDTLIGPFTATHFSRFFREVELDYDREEGALNVVSYDTHTHPDRPADLPREDLTLESTFAKSGIGITFSSDSGTIVDTSEAGANERWSEQELHDSMSDHWDSFDNSAQWKMWLFAAKLANSDSLGGIMFDGDIDEPGGVDRQGTALFTTCPFFHTEGGGYIVANPPTAEAVTRELFFNLIHETGHAFNLAHSFQKELGEPWSSPDWMPLESDAQSLSWMNYPDAASPGLNASWFYNRFRFQFDDSENLFLRHAPERFVQMGNEAWFENHGRVSRESLDSRLELLVRTLTPTIQIGQPLQIEFRLRNRSDEPIMAHSELALSDGFMRVAITDPVGNRTPFIPVSRARCYPKPVLLKKDERRYCAESLTMGRFGFPFKIPGVYRIEAAFHNLDGSTAVSVMQLVVAAPSCAEEVSAATALFNARVGRAINFEGTRVMDDVNDRIDWTMKKLPAKHPSIAMLRTTQAMPYGRDQKVVKAGADRVQILPADPDRIYKSMKPIVESGDETANALGHIAYQRAVNAFTQCSIAVNKLSDARAAQEQMLAVFKRRKVIQPVIRAIEKKVGDLQKSARSSRKKATKKVSRKRSVRKKTKTN